MKPIDWRNTDGIVFFTGAGMSAESGVPTYRGRGGVWNRYNWEAYACQEAFDRDPEKVIDFHERRREAVLNCEPHEGHRHLARMEEIHPGVMIVTQNIDGMHQRAGSRAVIELHGSLWRLRCAVHGVREDHNTRFSHKRCPDCGSWLRPDIVWFGDALDPRVMESAARAVSRCDLFVSIGTSGVVWPAAGFHRLAMEGGATMVEINPERTEASELNDITLREPASRGLADLFPLET